MRRSAVLGAAVVALLVAGCGVVEDESPRVLAPEAVPPGLLEPVTTTVTTTPTGETACVEVYLVDSENRLVPVGREVPAPATVTGAVRSLFDPVQPQEENLRNAIPSGTTAQVLGVDEDAEYVTVDVSDDLLDVTGDSRRQALAQIVYTATAFPEIDAVLLRVEGEPRALPDASGATKTGPFRRSDYPGFVDANRERDCNATARNG